MSELLAPMPSTLPKCHMAMMRIAYLHRRVTLHGWQKFVAVSGWRPYRDVCNHDGMPWPCLTIEMLAASSAASTEDGQT